MRKQSYRKALLTRVGALLGAFLLLVLPLMPAAQAFSAEDPICYITAAADKTVLVEGKDADANGNYPLTFTAKTRLPEAFGSYIRAFGEYVTSLTIRIDMFLSEGMIMDENGVSAECAFGDVTSVTQSGRVFYISVGLKPGTKTSDYTEEQWASVITLRTKGYVEGSSFQAGGELQTYYQVTCDLAGSHPQLSNGSMATSLKGVMDPDNEYVTVKMVAANDPAAQTTTSNAAGTNGTAGTNSANGTAGTTGAAGTTGTTGANGANGTTGTNGANGTTTMTTADGTIVGEPADSDIKVPDVDVPDLGKVLDMFPGLATNGESGASGGIAGLVGSAMAGGLSVWIMIGLIVLCVIALIVIVILIIAAHRRR